MNQFLDFAQAGDAAYSSHVSAPVAVGQRQAAAIQRSTARKEPSTS